jgi:hypothetical protein
MYSYTLSLTSAQDGVGVQHHDPAALPRERSGTHCIGGWGGGCGREQRISPPPEFETTPDRPVRSQQLYRLSYPGPPCPEVGMKNMAMYFLHIAFHIL